MFNGIYCYLLVSFFLLRIYGPLNSECLQERGRESGEGGHLVTQIHLGICKGTVTTVVPWDGDPFQNKTKKKLKIYSEPSHLLK